MKNTGPLEQEKQKQEKKEANTCIGLGVGVGALGAAGAAIAGAACPICYVVAPALVGAGLIKRHRLKREENEGEDEMRLPHPPSPPDLDAEEK